MARDVREVVPPAQPAEPYNGTQRRFPLNNRPMAVHVTLRFLDPVKVEYTRSYDTSENFKPTAEICSALLRRLEHCSEELITRKDAAALQPGPDKPLRFEICFQLTDAPCSTKERIFRSYQAKPSSMEQATDVILAADRMIGLFFLRHDKDFKWASGPVRENVSGKPRTAKPGAGAPESLACVPRCRFFPSTQSYEFVPGYEIELAFNSTCSARRPQSLSKTIRLTSGQCSPLNQSFGEEMLSAATKAVNSAIDSRKRALVGFRWLSAMNDSVSIDLRIRNNLGPDHEHLTYRLDSKQGLFNSPNGLDCIMFLDEVYRSLSRVRDKVDDAIGGAHELEVKVLELRGARWEAVNPLSVFLDPTISYSRRTVEAILDRVQTGVTSVLHGKDNSITLSIYHRGHLVLDKTLIAHSDTAPAKRPSLAMTPEQEGNVLIAKLAERIQGDIAMVCKDTCALDIRGDALPNLRMVQKSYATRLPEPTRAETPPRQTVPRQQLLYTPPPSSHSNTHKTALARDARSSFTSSPPPRTPYRYERRPRHEAMDLTPPATPSLADGDLETPRDNMMVTPQLDLRRVRGMSEMPGCGPRIVDDDASVHETIVRDFAHLASHVDSGSKEYHHAEQEVPISKSDCRFGGPLVPEAPVPVRNIVIAAESEHESLLDAASKAATSTKEAEDLPVTASKAVATIKQDEAQAIEPAAPTDPAGDDTAELAADDKPVAEVASQSIKEADPLLGDGLEYRCEPSDTLETVPYSPPLSPEPGEASSEGKTTDKIGPEGGWLEYMCEPLEAITEDLEPTDLPLEGWLEYWCEPIDHEEDAPVEATPEEPESVESPVVEGWLEYWCEPLEPEEDMTRSSPEPIPTVVQVVESESTSINVVAVGENDKHTSSGDERSISATSVASTTPALTETSDSDAGSVSSSEVAYNTTVECTGKELHLEIPPPSTTTTVFLDSPDAVINGVLPATLDDPLPTQREEGASSEDRQGPSTDVQVKSEGRGDLEVLLHEASQTLVSEPLDQIADTEVTEATAYDQHKVLLPAVVPESKTTTNSHDADLEPPAMPPTPDDDVLPGFFQDEAAGKGKEVAPDMESGERGESSLEAEEGAELARAVADIDAAVARSRDVGQSKDAAAEVQQGPEAGDELAQAVAEIDVAVESRAITDMTIDDLAKDSTKSLEGPMIEDSDKEDDLDIARAVAEIDAQEISRAVAEIDAAVEKEAPVVAEKSASAVNDKEDDLDIAQAVAEIDTAVEKEALAGDGALAVAEKSALAGNDKEDDLDIARAVAEIDAQEISRAVAEIDAAVEKESLAGDGAIAVAEKSALAGNDKEDDLDIARAVAEIDAQEISRAVAEIDAAVERQIPTETLAISEKPTSGIDDEEDDLDIALAVAAIDRAVKCRETATREEKARKVLEGALSSKNSLEIAQAIADIDAAIERRRAEREADGPSLAHLPKAVKPARSTHTHGVVIPPPLPARPRPRSRHNSLVIRPSASLQVLTPIRPAPAPPRRPRTAVPFSNPTVCERNDSGLTAGHLGLHGHGDYVLPLQDALLGTQSGDNSLNASSSSRASPLLSPVTAECKPGLGLGLPELPRAAVTVERSGRGEEEEAAMKDGGKKGGDGPREATPPSTPKGTYGALPGFMFWAAGVTIASSVFRRA